VRAPRFSKSAPRLHWLMSAVIACALSSGCGQGSTVTSPVARTNASTANRTVVVRNAGEDRPASTRHPRRREHRLPRPASELRPARSTTRATVRGGAAARTVQTITDPVGTRSWDAVASLRLAAVGQGGFTYSGPLAGRSRGRLTIHLTMRASDIRGTFVADLPGGTISGSVDGVTHLTPSQIRFVGQGIVTHGTARYAHVSPTHLTLRGTGTSANLAMTISGSLRY